MSGHQRPNRGLSDVWLTPPEILEALVAAGGKFELDPAAAPEPRPWDTAERHITLPEDGLLADWGTAYAWCNPPFGREVGGWLHRMGRHGNGVALCAARTETEWFRSAVWGMAASVLFLAARPHFHLPTGERAAHNSGVPICLVAYGHRAARTLARVSLDGALVTGWSIERPPP